MCGVQAEPAERVPGIWRGACERHRGGQDRRAAVVVSVTLRTGGAEREMDDAVTMDPRKLAAVVYDLGVAVDELLLVFARDLATEGVRLGGVIQLPRGSPGCGPNAPRMLRDVATGETFSICRDLGRGAEDCALNPTALRHAAGRIRAAIDSDADLIFVSRFGKEEGRGHGLRRELARATFSGCPVLTAVPRGMVHNWLSLRDGMATMLDAHLWVLKNWWGEIARGGDRVSARVG